MQHTEVQIPREPESDEAPRRSRTDLGSGTQRKRGGDLPPENIAPTLLYRWKSKFKEAGIQGLHAMKRGPKKKDHEKEKLSSENKRLTAALCESSIELLLLKKSVSSGWMDRS